MAINISNRTQLYQYQVDTDKMKQRLRQSDKSDAKSFSKSDCAEFSEAGRNALERKMSEINRLGAEDVRGRLSSVSSTGVMNDFERIMSELNGGNASDDFVTENYSQEKVDGIKPHFENQEAKKENVFDRHVNQMISTYNLMKDTIEEKYTVSDRQQEYYVADDGSVQELTKEIELEMLDKAYKNHSIFMATSTQIWSELQDFKVQVTYQSNSGAMAQTEVSTGSEEKTDIKGIAYRAFMSALGTGNSELLNNQVGNLYNVQFNLGISPQERDLLNRIWNFYANR